MTKCRLLMISFLLPLCVGFRAFVDINPWVNVSNANAVTRKIFISYPNGTKTMSNDIKGSDPLNAAEAELTVDTVMQSIIDDYNNVESSYIALATITDSDYVAGTSPTIIIDLEGSSGTQSGEARPNFQSGKISSCEIGLKESSVMKGARSFIATTAHEIGHCLGLLHPQETTVSIMSYFRDSNTIRLQVDDKMALAYLYPIDPDASAENNTLGLRCSKR